MHRDGRYDLKDEMRPWDEHRKWFPVMICDSYRKNQSAAWYRSPELPCHQKWNLFNWISPRSDPARVNYTSGSTFEMFRWSVADFLQTFGENQCGRCVLLLHRWEFCQVTVSVQCSCPRSRGRVGHAAQSFFFACGAILFFACGTILFFACDTILFFCMQQNPFFACSTILLPKPPTS